MKGIRAQHRRRAFAALCALLWILGIEVLPNLHLGFHDETTHTHAPSGMVVTVTFGAPAHAHDDGSVHAHDAADHAAELSAAHERERDRDQLAIDDPLPDHDAAGIAHRADALHAAFAPLLAPLPVVHVTENLIELPTGRIEVAFLATADARGPPVA